MSSFFEKVIILTDVIFFVNHIWKQSKSSNSYDVDYFYFTVFAHIHET